MNTKSAIQLVAEALEAKSNFFEGLKELLEKYDVQNNVFVWGSTLPYHELTEGYFGEVAQFDTIEKAAGDFNIFCQGLWINNGKYIVGNVYRNLSDVKEERIIDLKNSQVL